MTPDEEYPEHARLHAVKDDSQAVGGLIDWLNEHGYYICERREAGASAAALDDMAHSRCAKHWVDSFVEVLAQVAAASCLYWPAAKYRDQLLAEHFGINLDKLEAEKRAMLERLRAAHAAERG